MKKMLFFLLIALLAAGCGEAPVRALDQLNLDQGAVRVYTYQAYQPADSDPSVLIQAVFQYTETVVDRKVVPHYVVVHVKRELKLVSADQRWTTGKTPQVSELWYVYSGNQIYSLKSAVDPNNIRLSDLIFSYDFPLSVGKNWCPLTYDPHDASHTKITDCRTTGQREVVKHEASYTVPAGTFDDCYDIVDHYSSGNIFQTFCTGVGVVSLTFDHASSQFGFKQNLSTYTAGIP